MHVTKSNNPAYPSSQFAEGDTRIITVPDVSVTTLQAIVDYCATSRITITQDNVQDLYFNADRSVYSVYSLYSPWQPTADKVNNQSELVVYVT